jgi:peptidoglycan/xylan/chitin deacetylase (PgdA/CDA1 family)
MIERIRPKQRNVMSLYTRISQIAADTIKRRYNPDARSGVLYFHRVMDRHCRYYPDDITIAELDRLLFELKRFFTIVPLSDILSPTESDDKPKLGISFDDGYKDNITNALPLLRKHNVPATVFIATAGLDEGILFQDKIIDIIKAASSQSLSEHNFASQGKKSDRPLIASQFAHEMKYYPLKKREEALEKMINSFDFDVNDFSRLMLSSDELLTLSKDPLITIGAHTHDHAILSTLTEYQVDHQLSHSKDVLERIIGREVDIFCYPNGNPEKDFSPEHISMIARAGFKMAFTTQDGGADQTTNRMTIPRFLPFRRQSLLRSLSAIKISGEIV